MSEFETPPSWVIADIEDVRPFSWPVADVPVAETIWKTAAIVPVSLEMLIDFGHFPWLRADRNPFPRIVPFPRVARWQHRARAARDRLAETWGVLTHGLPERDEDDW